MAGSGVQKESLDGAQDAVAAENTALGLEDGEHVKDGDESGGDTKLDLNENDNGDVEKEEGAATTPAVVTDIEKKRKRAERFGTDLKISEAEKRKLRAARFNHGSKNGSEEVAVAKTKVPVASSNEAKKALIAAENAKRKARAERFGSVAKEVAVKAGNEVGNAKPKLSHDEEAKKKARMARFAMEAK